MDRVMKMEIRSKEMIKPSSPTPPSLRNFQLSLLDQLSPQEYVPMIFYYEAGTCDGTGRVQERPRVDRLKHSLSLTLAKFYPLAGRVRENRFIECNDDGVEFIEAEANLALSEVLAQPSAEVVDRLLPGQYHSSSSFNREIQLAIQANVFTCGGIAIGVCVLHKIVDGVTFASLMNSWAANSRGSGYPFPSPLFVGPYIFPQRDLSGLLPALDIPKDKCVTKRFVFEGSKIALLRENIKGRMSVENPSRVESIAALIWRCAMDIHKTRSGGLTQSVLTQTVNLRARMDPPLPDYCAGNLLWLAIAPAPEFGPKDQEVELRELVNQVRGSIRKFDAEHVSKMQGKSGFSVIVESLQQVVELVSQNVDIYRFSSLGRFQFYEADFGWGKPIWVSSAGLAFKNVIVLIETRGGDGIEAWVTLEEGDMAIFERNRELISFVSTNSSMSRLPLHSKI